MNYLSLVNKVLIRLRENEVTTIQESPYSKLIGEFVNVVKREVEDTWNWSALRGTVTANTLPNVYSYELSGLGIRGRIIDVINDTDDFEMRYQTTRWFDKQFLTGNVAPNSPQYYNLNGVSDDGDHFIDLFPPPDAAYVIRVNAVIPQADLQEDSDTIRVPYQVVVEGALARAISERGDDGGYTEQEARYNRILSDYIAMDAGNRPDEVLWYPS
jgi:hypothetical protein